jgi:hypothetical protein
MTTARSYFPDFLPTVPLTDLRRFIQNREDDRLLLKLLRTEFDSIPAQAMLRHRMPAGCWKDGQVDGAEFHAELIDAVERGLAAEVAPAALRPCISCVGFALSRFLKSKPITCCSTALPSECAGRQT